MTEGIVIKAYGGFYYVQTQAGIVECRLRGKFRLSKLNALAGDRVEIQMMSNGTGAVEAIHPRDNVLLRPPVANVDQVLLVLAGHQPEPDFGLLDRMLILAESQQIQPVICFNKCDLLTQEERTDIFRKYEGTGYQLEIISAREQIGIDNIRRTLNRGVNVIAGPSGAGKSTLLNSIQPNLSLKTGKISEKIGRGKHTTRHVELMPLEGGGWVVDTPGFSNLDLPSLGKQQLGSLFPEFGEYSHLCRFNGCSHDKEPECRVKEAVEQGDISRERYDNYLVFLQEVRANERRY